MVLGFQDGMQDAVQTVDVKVRRDRKDSLLSISYTEQKAHRKNPRAGTSAKNLLTILWLVIFGDLRMCSLCQIGHEIVVRQFNPLRQAGRTGRVGQNCR